MNRILLCGKTNTKYIEPLHSHDTWEIICNFEGVGEMVLGEKCVSFGDKTVICVPPGIAHSKDSTDGFRDIFLWITDLSIQDITEAAVIEDDDGRSIYNLMNILYSVQYGKFSNKDAICNALIDSLEQVILSQTMNKHTDTRVDSIINKIIHNFNHEDFSIERCLEESGYCSDHIRRLFRQQTGKTPHEYLCELRIKAAKKLLATRTISNMAISEIAQAVGFSDVSYFSRIFKKMCGICPGKYKNDLS